MILTTKSMLRLTNGFLTALAAATLSLSGCEQGNDLSSDNAADTFGACLGSPSQFSNWLNQLNEYSQHGGIFNAQSTVVKLGATANFGIVAAATTIPANAAMTMSTACAPAGAAYSQSMALGISPVNAALPTFQLFLTPLESTHCSEDYLGLLDGSATDVSGVVAYRGITAFSENIGGQLRVGMFGRSTYAEAPQELAYFDGTADGLAKAAALYNYHMGAGILNDDVKDALHAMQTQATLAPEIQHGVSLAVGLPEVSAAQVGTWGLRLAAFALLRGIPNLVGVAETAPAAGTLTNPVLVPVPIN